MRNHTLLPCVVGAALLAGCGTGTLDGGFISGITYRSAITGDRCEPDATLVGDDDADDADREDALSNGGANSPTGIPGDNMDDEHSGQVDCLGDGDSGQGNDWKTEGCTVPSGCDAHGCCDESLLDPPADPEPPPSTPPPADCSSLNDACGVGVADGAGGCTYEPTGACAGA